MSEEYVSRSSLSSSILVNCSSLVYIDLNISPSMGIFVSEVFTSPFPYSSFCCLNFGSSLISKLSQLKLVSWDLFQALKLVIEERPVGERDTIVFGN